jgi:hypothetical protein
LSSYHSRIKREAGSGNKGDSYSAIDCEETDLVGSLEREDTLIVDDSGGFPEDVEGLPLPFLGFDHLSDRPDCGLGGEPVGVPDMRVTATMEGITGEVSFTPCCSGDEVAGLVEGLHGH